jgi:Cadherin-like domain
VLNANGAFIYTPAKNFIGTDTFSYYTLDVTPLSSANVAATVTITVTKK